MRHRKLPFLASALLFAVTACSDRLETPTESTADAELDLQAALQSSQGSEKVRVILTFKTMGGAHSMAASMAGAQAAGNGRVRRTYQHFPMVAIEVSENALPALRRAPGLVAITPDIAEPPALDQSLAVINADDVRALGWTGAGLTVAILDTGIDQDHPFFAGRIVSQACYSTHDPDNNRFSLCPGDAESSTAANSADTDIARCNNNGNLCDHGTHVAGIAAGDGTGVVLTNAQAAGVAPGADIIAIQVFTRHDNAADCSPNAAPCVLSYTSDQIAGLDRVFDLRNTYTIAAANMSLGGGQFNAACDGAEAARKTAIDQLITANIATVISAGNSGFNASVGAPGCISTAVTIGATDNTDAIAGFSNRGVLLDLFAPGVNNFSAGSNGGFEQKSGTSMAAPHVTGAWAIMRQVLGNASVADVLNRLQTTGVDIDYVSGGADVTTPRINLLAAIQTAADPPVLTVVNDPVTVDEGQTATNSGTYASDDGNVTLNASVGAVAGGGASDGNWSWSFDTNDGPAESQTVTITGTDQLDQDGAISFELVVNNVAPTVTIAAGQVMLIDEGENLSVNASFTDP